MSRTLADADKYRIIHALQLGRPKFKMEKDFIALGARPPNLPTSAFKVRRPESNGSLSMVFTRVSGGSEYHRLKFNLIR
jgi:hypothetical protein